MSLTYKTLSTIYQLPVNENCSVIEILVDLPILFECDVTNQFVVQYLLYRITDGESNVYIYFIVKTRRIREL